MSVTQPVALLHEQVANHVVGLIETGALRPGQRAPSVRRLSVQMKVSTATVVLAYSHLQAKGMLEARPQSGHYVRASPRPQLAEPRTVRARSGVTPVKLGDRVIGLYRTMRDRSFVSFGAAVPSPDLFPVARLNRSVSLVGRTAGSASGLYDTIAGNPTLRAHIARRAVGDGSSVRPDDVIITTGAIEAMRLCLRAVAAPGDAVVVERPTYFGALRVLEEMGLRAVEVPAHAGTGVDLAALTAAVDQHDVKACFVVPNFSNPLGAVMPDAAKKALVEAMTGRRVPIIETDVYGDLPHDGRRPRPLKAFDRDGWVLHCSSFSKTLAPGFRVGWAIPGRFHDRVEVLKFTQAVASPTITQMALADFFDGGGYDRHLRVMRRRLAAQVIAMREAVARHFPRGTRMSRPMGGFLLWVELPRGSLPAEELQRRALAKGISVAPGPIFGVRDGLHNCLRLSCGHPWSDVLEGAVATLGRLAVAT